MKYELHEDPAKDIRYKAEAESPCSRCEYIISLFHHTCESWHGKIPMKYWNNKKNCPRRKYTFDSGKDTGNMYQADLKSSSCSSCLHLRSAAEHSCNVYTKAIPAHFWNGEVPCPKRKEIPERQNYGTLDDRYWFDPCKTICKTCKFIQSFCEHRCEKFPEEIPPVYWNSEIQCPKYKNKDSE